MELIVEAGFRVEPLTTDVRKGSTGGTLGEVLGSIKPDVVHATA